MRVACLTWGKNESVFLQIWFKYYSSLFGEANCYIIDHASDRISPLEALEEKFDIQHLNVFRVPYQDHAPSQPDTGITRPFDYFRFKLISSFINGLLNYYDVVIYNDTDEIYIVDPSTGYDLPGYLKAVSPFSVMAGVGVEVLHDYKHENRIDLNKSILSQRKNFVYSILYSKPHIVSVPSKLGPHAVNRVFEVDPNLFLLHLKFVDADNLVERQTHLTQLHSNGVGGKDCRWGCDSAAILEILSGLLNRPVAPQNFSAHRLFQGKQSVPTGSGAQTRMRDAFSKVERHSLEGYLNKFPESFFGIV